MSRYEVRLGDCREQLRELGDATIDAIVTDPPYEIAFMGRGWDASGIAYDVGLWREALRVLKPGGHLLAFGAARTYHRVAVAIEDAGFEIRDSIHWMYGSGFPKSLDVSKAIDKRRDDRADVLRVTAWIRERRDAAGVTNAQIGAAFGMATMAAHWTSPNAQPAVPTLEQMPTLLSVLGVSEEDVPAEIRRLLFELNGRKGQPGEAWHAREVTGTVEEWTDRVSFAMTSRDGLRRDKPATDDAKTWLGWGTALKPAHEPIVVARKPLVGTVAANVLAHGTGAINVDGCRVKAPDVVASLSSASAALGGTREGWDRPWKSDPAAVAARQQRAAEAIEKANTLGRWPPNVVFSHLPACEAETCAEGCAIAELDAQSGASRFFPAFRYQAKPSRRERGPANTHPTVKPIELMRWCVRLVTPKGGTVLDPFTGSGTTGIAAVLEDARFVGVELSEEYRRIAVARIEAAQAGRSGEQLDLFDLEETTE